jgi:hypothetical protein
MSYVDDTADIYNWYIQEPNFFKKFVGCCDLVVKQQI